MNNTITIAPLELCAEDRARLDRLAEALERKNCDDCVKGALTWAENVQHTEPDPIQQKLAETMAKASDTAEAPKITREEAETSTPPTIQPEEGTPTEAEPEPAEEAKPAVTLEQIQQKVVQLAASNGGVKKAAVREIISAYGTKVSDLKEQPDKWTEVWNKLTALEKEAIEK